MGKRRKPRVLSSEGMRLNAGCAMLTGRPQSLPLLGGGVIIASLL